MAIWVKLTFKIGQKLAKIAQIELKLHEEYVKVRESVKLCEVSLFNSTAKVHTFKHPTC